MADKTIVYRLTADITSFRAQMAQAGASVKAAAGEMTGATASGVKFRSGLTAVGSVAGKVGFAAAAGLGAAIYAAANFDQAMSNVQAATHESGANLQRLRDAALEWGAKTKFSSTEAAQGIEALAKAGVSTNDVLRGGLKGALSLAAAGEIDVGDAAETAATAMTQFSLKGKDVPHIADLLAAGAGKAQGEVSDLAMALKQSGVVASQMGLNINETVGTLAEFAHAGLIGSDAGTSFRTMLLRLANPTQQSSQLMKQFGIDVYDAQGKLKPMSAVAGELSDAFKNQSDQTRNAALATIFGSDAIRAANILYRNGADGVKEWTDKVNDQGYAAETARIKMDNLRGDLEKLGGAFNTALVGTGEGAQGPLRGLVQNLTNVVDAYNKLPSPAKGGIAAALGLTAAGGLGLFAFSRIITGIADTRAAIDSLGTAGTRATTVMKGLSAAMVGIAAYELVDQLDDVSISTDRMSIGLNKLATGRSTHIFDDLSVGANNLGDALREAAYSDFDQLFGLGAGDEIQKIDKALAGLEKHDPSKAGAAFREIRAQAAAAGVDINDLVKLFPKYTAALNKAMQAGIKGNNLGWFAELAGQLTGNTELVHRLGASVKTLPKKAIVQILTPGVIKSGKDVVGLAKQFHLMPNEVKTIMRALDFTKPQINAVLKNLKNVDNQHPEPKIKADASQALGTARNVTQLMGGVGRLHPNVTISANAAGAISAARTLTSELNRIPRYVTTTVTVRHIGGNAPVTSQAEGGYIQGPGTTTSDSIPAMLSNREYVVKAAAVSKYGVDMLHSINAMRYAQGGLVGARPVTNSTSNSSVAVNFSGPIYTRDEREFARVSEQRFRDALALASMP